MEDLPSCIQEKIQAKVDLQPNTRILFALVQGMNLESLHFCKADMKYMEVWRVPLGDGSSPVPSVWWGSGQPVCIYHSEKEQEMLDSCLSMRRKGQFTGEKKTLLPSEQSSSRHHCALLDLMKGQIGEKREGEKNLSWSGEEGRKD